MPTRPVRVGTLGRKQQWREVGREGVGWRRGGGANNFCSVKTKMSLKCPIIENEVDMQRNVSDITKIISA